MNINQIISLKGNVDRKSYLFWGILLFAIKYNLDRFVSISFFDKYWIITDYFIQPDVVSVSTLNSTQTAFYTTLVVMAIPFIWFGTTLTIKRLRNATLPQWLVVLFFIPFLNLFLFLILSVVPAKTSDTTETHKNSFLDKLIPQSKTGSAAFAIGIIVFLALLLTLFSIQFLKEYGWSLFVGIPFFIGLGSTLIYGYHQPRTYQQCVSVCLTALGFFGVIIFMLAVEGIICIAMSAPIGIVLAWVGGTIGFSIQNNVTRSNPTVFFSLVVFLPFLIVAESLDKSDAPLIEIKSEIVINKSRSEVWGNLVAFNHMQAPDELLFKTGIAYPIKATITGKGAGAVRNCVFTTGPFVEPIEIWDEPRLLRFSVIDQPPPMTELSFYRDMNMPHLEDYFRSEKGQFLLTEMSPNQTKLEGTTWYRHNIWPSMYWRLWSDYILHKIHLRVLNHIKTKTENTETN